jgi:hypothetical protein
MKTSLVHPIPEDLAAYRSDALTAVHEQEIRTHLVACQECRELLLDLAALETSPPQAEDGGIPEIELEAAWRQQKKRLFPVRHRSLTHFGGWAVAASLLLVVGALAFEVRKLRRIEEGFYDVGLPRVIAEERDERSLLEELPVLEHGSQKPALVLLLLRNDLPFSSFRAEFFSEDQRSLLVRSGLPGQENLLVIQVPPSSLPEGRVSVAVSGHRSTGYVPIGQYAFQVHQP